MSIGISTFVHAGRQVANGLSLATPAFNAVTGNCIIVAVSAFNPAQLPQTPTDTALNNYSLIGTSPASPATLDGTPNIWFYQSNNIIGNSSNVITSSTVSTQIGFWQIVAWQISGAASGNPVNAFQIGGGTTGSNAQSTAPLTTTVANSIVLAYGSLANTGATYSVGSGYTIDLANSDDGGLSGAEHQIFSSIQTGIIPAINSTDSTHKWQMMAVAIAGPSTPPPSNAYSVPDCRNYGQFPNASRTVQGTKIYDVQTSSNPAVPGTDSRAAGAPVDSRVAAIIPQNSRTPGTFGPGE